MGRMGRRGARWGETGEGTRRGHREPLRVVVAKPVLRGVAPDLRPRTGNQLVFVDWLGDIVVDADFKGLDQRLRIVFGQQSEKRMVAKYFMIDLR